MIVTVYKITNTVNGKLYFGITNKTSAFRWKQHILLAKRQKRTAALQGAILKYGEVSFTVDDVYHAVSTREAQAVERGLIAQHGTMWPGGYNMSSGGEARHGYSHSQETKRKMRASAIGREIGENQRALARENTKRLWLDADFRNRVMTSQSQDHVKAARAINNEKLAAARRGKPGFFKGHHHTEESIAKMSASQKGRPAWNKGIPISDDQKKKLIAAHLGRTMSEEQKSKIKTRMNMPDVKAKMAATTTARWSDPEGREKMLANRTYPPRAPLTAEQRRERSEMMRRVMSDPARRERASASAKSQWADPEKRAAGIAAAQEKGLRKVETRLYGKSTAAVRALVRQLPTDYIRGVA